MEELFAEIRAMYISRFVEMLTNPVRESTRYSFHSSRLVTGVLSLKELQGQLVTGLFADQTFCTGDKTEGPSSLLACEMQPSLLSHSESHSNCVTPFTSVAECVSLNYTTDRPAAEQGRGVWDRHGSCIPQQEQSFQMNSRFVSGHHDTDIDCRVQQESNKNAPRVLAFSHYEVEFCPQRIADHLAAKCELVTGK